MNPTKYKFITAELYTEALRVFLSPFYIFNRSFYHIFQSHCVGISTAGTICNIREFLTDRYFILHKLKNDKKCS